MIKKMKKIVLIKKIAKHGEHYHFNVPKRLVDANIIVRNKLYRYEITEIKIKEDKRDNKNR